MLIASMNPCPCGYYGSNIRECTCSQTAIKNYLSKISGPLLDRIDINVNVKPVEYKNLESTKKNRNIKRNKTKSRKSKKHPKRKI